MDLALAAADLVVSRAGSATVSELTALGLPAVFVPYPVGNGEQRFNAARRRRRRAAPSSSPTPTSRRTGCADRSLPLLAGPALDRRHGRPDRRHVGHRDGADRMVDLVLEARASRHAAPPADER